MYNRGKTIKKIEHITTDLDQDLMNMLVILEEQNQSHTSLSNSLISFRNHLPAYLQLIHTELYLCETAYNPWLTNICNVFFMSSYSWKSDSSGR